MRWTPGVSERLQQVALDLYATRGYDVTTVADIAGAAGVTPRTYFRHFPDKREVLFANADAMRQRITDGAKRSPAASAPWTVVLDALAATDDLFTVTSRDDLARRAAVIASAPELREREAGKLQLIADAVAHALASRGVERPVARVVADLGMVVFTEASRLWQEQDASFADCVAVAAGVARASIERR